MAHNLIRRRPRMISTKPSLPGGCIGYGHCIVAVACNQVVIARLTTWHVKSLCGNFGIY
jgi:hypothetical protein